MRDARAMAKLARETPRLRVGSLAHLPQEAHRQAVGCLQRRAGRSAVLWMDRQPHQTDRRRPIRAQIHAAQTREQLVEHQHQALQRAESGKEAGRPRACAQPRRPAGRRRRRGRRASLPTSRRPSSRTRRRGRFSRASRPRTGGCTSTGLTRPSAKRHEAEARLRGRRSRMLQAGQEAGLQL